MSNSQTEEKLISESEAAGRLGISLEQLHRLLDNHIFNNGEARPQCCQFRNSDLVLLGFWQRTNTKKKSSKVLRMPKRS